jgi:uncharacterized protein YdeI (YjbR/CyaY-like superfamily)
MNRDDHEKATFFETPAKLRRWLSRHHGSATELWVGAHRKGTGRPTLTWEQIVDELLCYGWIDGVRRGLPDGRWAIRVTPRKKGSNWSAKNVRRIAELEDEGRMTEAGRKAFAARDPAKPGYSYETAPSTLPGAMERRLRADAKAWAWFSDQAPSYRRTVTHWVMSAKRDETRERRMDALIEDSAAGRKVKPLRDR